MNIVLERIRPWYELQLCDEQNGFRKNRGTTEGIYHGHIVTGDLRVIENKKLRNLICKGPNFREPRW